jgi:hypothetical protein
MELRHISHAFGDQQRFFAWEMYYALCEEGLQHYLVLLRYLGRRPRPTFSANEIRAETGENARSVSRRLLFLSEHACLRSLSAPGSNGIRKNPSYALSDFGRCVMDCLSQAEPVPAIDADVQRLAAMVAVRTHRHWHHFDWAAIDPVLLADIQGGLTQIKALADKYGINPVTLEKHLHKIGMLKITRHTHQYEWSRIDPILRADIQGGLTHIMQLAKKHGIPKTTLQNHLKRTGMLHG